MAKGNLTRAAIESQLCYQRTSLCATCRPQYRRASATVERAIMAMDKVRILESLSSVIEDAMLMDVALAAVRWFWELRKLNESEVIRRGFEMNFRAQSLLRRLAV